MQIQDYEKLFKALANRRRLSIIIFLKSRKSATVGQISSKIKLSFRSTSKHLSVLVSANFVDKEQVGINMNYSLIKPMPQEVSKTISLFAHSYE